MESTYEESDPSLGLSPVEAYGSYIPVNQELKSSTRLVSCDDSFAT